MLKFILCENGIFNSLYKACSLFIYQEYFTTQFLLLVCWTTLMRFLKYPNSSQRKRSKFFFTLVFSVCFHLSTLSAFSVVGKRTLFDLFSRIVRAKTPAKTLKETTVYHGRLALLAHGFQKFPFLPIHKRTRAVSKRFVFKRLHF